MSFIKQFGKSVIIAFNRNIFVRNEGQLWSHQSISLDVPTEKGCPRKYFDADSDSENEEIQSMKKYNGHDNDIQIVALDVNDSKSLLAIALSDKSLYLYKLIDTDGEGQLKFLSKRLVSRTSSCLKFAANGKFLVVCDKAGDCYKYDCEEYKKPGLWLLGHMSQILDVLIDADDSALKTLDLHNYVQSTLLNISAHIQSLNALLVLVQVKINEQHVENVLIEQKKYASEVAGIVCQKLYNKTAELNNMLNKIGQGQFNKNKTFTHREERSKKANIFKKVCLASLFLYSAYLGIKYVKLYSK